MPKRRGSGRRRGGGRRSATVRIPFSGFVVQTLASGIATIPVAPTAAGLNIPRLTTVSDPFEKYRFTRFRFRLMVDAGSTAGDSSCCYLGKSAASTGITTLAEAQETGLNSFVTTKQTVHGNWVNVPKTVLAGMLQWYQTQGGSGSSDTEEDNQGELYFIGTSASVLRIETRGVIELSVAVDPANTPTPLEVLLAKKISLDGQIEQARIARETAHDKEKAKLVALFPVLKALTPITRQ